MAAEKDFRCTLITPERQVFSGPATFVVLPAHDGEVGILKNRAPLMCKLGIGLMRIETNGNKQRYFVDGGFAQVVGDDVTVLTPHALEPSEVDRAAAEKALADAKSMPTRGEEAIHARNDAMKRAAVQLKLASRA